MEKTGMKGKALEAIAASAVLGVLFFPAMALAVENEFGEVTTAIQQKSSSWTAKDNRVAGNKPVERRKRLGAIFPFPNAAVRTFDHSSPSLSLPVRLDWRNYNHNNYVTPIKEQGTCGACWAFATTAALESKVLIARNTPNRDMDLSEQVLASCSDAGNCAAGSITVASDFLSNYGLPPESFYPYTEADGSCTTAGANWEASALAVAGWHLMKPDAATLKRALYNYGPLVALLAVHTDFYYYSSGIYRYAWGDFEGYHAALIVGYDDAEQCFVVKSSWGTD
jgi:C1A family cysteine protease